MKYIIACILLMLLFSCSPVSYEVNKALKSQNQAFFVFSYIRGIESESSYDCTNKKRVLHIRGNNCSMWCISINADISKPHTITSIAFYKEPSKLTTKWQRAKQERSSQIKSISMSPFSIKITDLQGRGIAFPLSGIPFFPLCGRIDVKERQLAPQTISIP